MLTSNAVIARLSFVLTCAGPLAAACGSDDPTGDTDASTSDESTQGPATTTGEDATGSITSESVGESEGESETGVEPPPTYEYARGLRVESVAINQGVQVELVRAGIEVDPASYSNRLVTGRQALVRARWSLHADFVPREIIGRLTLTREDGTRYVDDFKVMINGPSNDAELTNTFSWLLPAEELTPGVQYRVEAFEPDESLAEGEVSDPPPVAPLAGKGALALVDTPLEMRVVIVPVLHQLDGCESAPDITDAEITEMAE
jgi:hypothetical protein